MLTTAKTDVILSTEDRVMRKQKNNTIEEVTAIIRGDQPKRNKKLRGAIAGLTNEGGITSVSMRRRNGDFGQKITLDWDVMKGAMPGSGAGIL